jgi:hypothetical protein
MEPTLSFSNRTQQTFLSTYGKLIKFSAWYSILVGVLMFGQWSFFLAVGSVPEIQTEPIAIVFHLASKLATAVGLLVGGIGLLRQAAWAQSLTIFAAGMLAYTTIVSPDYFAQTGQWPLVGMFAILLGLDLVSISIMMRVKVYGTSLDPDKEP